MIRKSLLGLMAFLFLAFDLISGNTKLSGVVENASGYTIRLKSFTDYVSFQDTILAEAYLDERGGFEMDLNIDFPQNVILKLGFQKATFYVEPNKNYELKVYYDPEKEQISYLANYQLLFEFINLPKDDLNVLAAEFNIITDQFLVENFNRIYRSRQTHLLDSLRYQVQGIRRRGLGYFDQIVEFRLADILLSVKSHERENLFFNVFANKPIQYNNYEYMFFFNTFFYKYVQTKTSVLKPGELRSLINEQEDLTALSNALKRDLIFMDDRMRELVILHDLYYYFYDFDFKLSKVMQHLRSLSNNSVYPEHRKIAKNLIKRITALQPGKPIPEFSLTDLDGQQKTNNDYKGKYLLLNFWELDCSDCFKNIDSLEYLQTTYKNKMNVVSISSNKFEMDLKKIIKDKNISMNFLMASPDNKVYDDLKIRSLPAAILVNDQGEIVLYPAILPGRGFRNTFKSVFKQ